MSEPTLKELADEMVSDLREARGTIPDDLHDELCKIGAEFLQDLGVMVQRINSKCETSL